MKTVPFFDQHPNFYHSSATGSTPSRLNARYKALIEANRSFIKNKTVLDLGSHDGRWAFAAINNGAKKVTGIEVRSSWIQKAELNFNALGVSRKSYNFIHATVDEALPKLETASFDTVFCFGLLYHHTQHSLILRESSRIVRDTILIDTMIYPSIKPHTFRFKEYSGWPSNGAKKDLSSHWIPVKYPTQQSLKAILKKQGFEMKYHNWQIPREDNFSDLEDYFLGFRISLAAHRSKTR